MENFIVSARKYRPITFDTVVGQPSITTTLKNAIRNNHLAQAFLFCGPRGVGKTTCARILAKTINCENRTKDVEACNVCESCISFNNNHSLNIYELDAASNNSVDDIRALVEQVRYPPQAGKYKVYIIDEVHMLSASAFNAFLKTLEEPPTYAIFILATTEKHKIIPTILSRCQIFDFNRIQIDDIVKHLKSIAKKEGVEAEEDGLHVIAQKSDGALRDALSMFDQLVSFAGNHLTYKAVIENLNILDYDYYFQITDQILAHDIANTFLTFNEILNNGFDGHHFINGLSSHFRDLLVCKDEITLQLLEVSPNIREKYKQQSAKCTAPILIQWLDIADKCDINYRQAKNQRLHVEITLLKMCNLPTGQAGLNVEAHSPEPVKKKAEPVSKPVAAPQPTTSSIAKEPEPEKLKPAVSIPTKESSPSKIISIKDALKPKENNEGVTMETKLSSPGNEKKNNEFTLDALLKAWNAFAGTLLKQGKMALHAAMTKRAPELRDQVNVIMKIEHTGLEKDVNDIKSELQHFLKSDLGNNLIQLNVEVDKSVVAADKPYTQKEKFKYMAEKNPALNDLRNQLDLDIEY
jgi:DNA polymerase-3 subunit gamma/tau